jgi:hypothetical protein
MSVFTSKGVNSMTAWKWIASAIVGCAVVLLIAVQGDSFDFGGGGSGGSSSNTIATSEADGNPAVAATDTIIFPNSSLTNNGDGSVTVAFPSGNGVTVGDAVSGTANNGLLYSDASGEVAELDCADGEVPTQSAGAWTCGTVDAANRALSNLASVALNTALLPDAAAADDFGSATLPFKDFFLAGSSGTPGTNNFKITGASTSGTRVITLPNATATLAGTTVALGGTGATSFTGSRCVQTNAGGTALESASAGCASGSFVIALASGSGTAYSYVHQDNGVYAIGVGETHVHTSANEMASCVPVPVASTLTKVSWIIRNNGVGQSDEVTDNLLQVRNISTTTNSTGVSTHFPVNTTAIQETTTLAFAADECVVARVTASASATDPTNVKIHATLYFTVP